MKIDSDALRYYRKAEKLSQKELADKAGISHQMVSALDRGYQDACSDKVLAALSIVLHVDMKDLVLDESTFNPFDKLDEKTRVHLEEQGYNKDNWEAYNAPSGPTNIIGDDIDEFNQVLSVTGFAIDRKRTDFSAGIVVIKNGLNSYQLSVQTLNQFVISLSDFASYSLSQRIKTDGKALAPAYALPEED